MAKSLRSPRQRQLLELLVKTRQSRGLTQAAVAARLGKPQSFVAKVECGERRLDVIEFIELALAMKVRPVDLIARLESARASKRKVPK
ncbi:MAG: helix-turn-helix transcriptional regulator [Alphaproteobacteria bacterium]|nr:helix-turn-helix transcriptional regulator [Alphaproteobacteria bacterium]MBM3641093.1 helix-turn-helix transcriptional regulator [Alphaproteobacteria bacterium]MBM3652643.1 helix-turn-helix transcriptional regulator [Alphaproteobacteria bacterium]